MLLDIRNYFLLFILYSCIGWALEVIYTYITDKKITDRGFLIGPYCPVYGTGTILIILLLSNYKENPIVLFILAIVICSILEYTTSYIMEKIFKARWWDYTNRKYNINGRICLETMVPFGLAACFIIYLLNPMLESGISKIPGTFLSITSIVIGVIFITDLITSFNVVNNFKKTVKKATLEDRTEDINKYIRELIQEKSFFHRRLIKAFPNAKTKLGELKKDIKTKIKKA